MSISYICDVISIATIATCFILKVPQILRLHKTKSPVGLSINSLLLELTSYTIMMSYNYANGYSLLLYLEYPIIVCQQLVLIYLIQSYSNGLTSGFYFGAAIYFAFCALVLSEVVSLFVLSCLAPLCTPVSVSSKLVQLAAILRTGNAESVSTFTWFLSALTNFARFFTIWMETADVLLLGNLFISTLLSSSIMSAAIYYKYRPRKCEG